MDYNALSRDNPGMVGYYDQLVPPPRNPTRMPQGVEDAAYGALVEPLWDVAKGVGALATGQGMVPEVGAGIMGAMGLLSPMKAGALTKGIRAFHGSPHKFAPEPGAPLGRFSMDKIGTGEGAQAYGHGLYFAGNEAVAKAYRDSVTGGSDSAMGSAKYLLRMNKGDYDAALAELRSRPAKVPDAIAFDKEVEKHLLNRSVSPGHMYEVNINARPEQFLDWDRPLKDQPAILKAASRFGPDVENRLAREKYSPGKQFNDIVANEGLPLGQATEANISAAMREAGIPGIKYLDQGSRTQVDDPATVLKNIERAQTQVDRARQSGDAEWLSRAQNDLMQWSKDYDLVTGKQKGTSNYVVFSDDLVDILKRYGLMGAALSPAAYGATQSEAVQ